MILDGIDLSDPDTFVNGIPHAAFKRLRAEAPVYWQPEQVGKGFWALTRYADLVAVSKDPLTFSSARGGTNLFELNEEELSSIRMLMLNMDPPRHNKFRRLVSTGFTARMVTQLEPHIREICAELVENVAARGSFDFVTEVAAELPLLVIAEMLGVPATDRHQVFDWSNRLVGFDDPEYRTSMADGKIAAVFVMPRIANLLETYATKPAVPCRPQVDEMLTIAPPPRAVMPGITACMPSRQPIWLTSITRR